MLISRVLIWIMEIKFYHCGRKRSCVISGGFRPKKGDQNIEDPTAVIIIIIAAPKASRAAVCPHFPKTRLHSDAFRVKLIPRGAHLDGTRVHQAIRPQPPLRSLAKVWDYIFEGLKVRLLWVWRRAISSHSVLLFVPLTVISAIEFSSEAAADNEFQHHRLQFSTAKSQNQ